MNNQIGDIDVTEDITNNGKALLRILGVSQDELKNKTADDFKKIIRDCCITQSAQNKGISVAEMKIEDVYAIEGRGAVVCGLVKGGTIKIGDSVEIVRSSGNIITTVVTGIEKFGKLRDSANPSKTPYGLLLRGLTKADIKRGDKLIKKQNKQC